MIPVPMRYKYDCWRASLASILELPYEEVPETGPIEGWYEETREWLKKFGVDYMEMIFTDNTDPESRLRGYHIIVGDSPRLTGIKHAVVGRDGRMIWDPCPDGLGVEGTKQFGFFILMEPSLLFKEKKLVAQDDKEGTDPNYRAVGEGG
jgi:hypothetical protein